MLWCLNLLGGAKESRTPDLLRARQALYQLSYGPINGGSNKTWTYDPRVINTVL